MEPSQNIQVMAKRIRRVVRVAFFMLRKGFCKSKLLVHLNTMLKRGKIAGGNSQPPPREYEFSCINTPNYTFLPLHAAASSFFGRAAHAPAAALDDNDAVEDSPALPGFGRSPFVRPLRITDSPFPLTEDVDEEEDNGYVDKAAEEFIQKFYKELKKQKINMADF